MWDRVARFWLALGAVAGLFALDSCGRGGPHQGTSSQACRLNADCSGSTPRCDPERRICVQCTTNTDCAESEICTTANTCRIVIPCVSRTECPLDLVCDQNAGFCVDCVGDNDCDDGEICAEGSQCRIGCDSDKDCQQEGLLCALDEGVCVVCADHIDCAESEYCQSGTCVADKCDPGHQECAGDELLTCSPSGSGFDSETCPHGCIGEPGSASCAADPDGTATSASGGSSGSSGGSSGSGGGSSGSGGSSAGGSAGDGSGGTSGAAGTGESSGGSGGSTTSGGSGGDGGSGNTGAGGNGGSGGVMECGSPFSIAVTYRDFDAVHPDFAPGYASSGVSGVVAERLNDDGKPVLVGDSNSEANIESPESFAEWYSDGPKSATIQGEMVLYDDGEGGFVNRWGPNGEPWIAYRNVELCGGANCTMCPPPTPGQTCVDPCPSFWGSGTCRAVLEELDGNPLFFPIDGDPALLNDAPQPAKIPPDYGPEGWPWEQDYLGNDAVHNFLFTTEIHIEFAYDANRTQRFSFLGDDDLWVFLNGQLIIDLGGWHEPQSGDFSLNGETADSYGLVDGEMYEISVFHAERQPDGSSFLMRLEGFADCE